MGSEVSKVPCAIVNSPSRSVVSDPLDEFLTVDKFWELYAAQLRAGPSEYLLAQLGGAGVTSHQTRDQPDGGFEAKDVLSGGIFAGGSETICSKHCLDKEKQEWHSKWFGESFDDADLREEVTIKAKSSPFVIEAWSDVKKQRIAKGVGYILQAILTEVLKRAGCSQTLVTVQDGVESPSGDGQLSAVSEVLDEELTPDKFWALYVAFVKDGLGKPNVKRHRVQEIDVRSFLVIDTFYVPPPESETYEKFVFDASKDHLVSYTYEQDESMSEASCNEAWHTQVYRDPLRVELYREVMPGRKATMRTLGIIQAAVDGCIRAAESSGSWLG